MRNISPTHVKAPKPKLYQVCRQIPKLRELRRQALLEGQTVGFVPTMGALHEGHLALVRQAARENYRVYVSIYVNPTQFGVNEDLASYPRPWGKDLDKLSALCEEFNQDERMGQITTIFAPKTRDMYPNLPPTSEIDGKGSFVTITPLSSILEGASRPVFFRGVATVVMKLLNIVQPEKVYFGQKDVQQTYVVRRMIEDFHLDTQIRVGPTVRESDGLALSSRNVYLGARRRAVATVLLKALVNVQYAFEHDKRRREDLLVAAYQVAANVQDRERNLLPAERARFDVDYFSLADPKTMEELEVVNPAEGAILSGAIKMLPIEDPQEGEDTGLGGGITAVRLIDNIKLDLLSSRHHLIPELDGSWSGLRPQAGPGRIRKIGNSKDLDRNARKRTDLAQRAADLDRGEAGFAGE